MEWIKVRGTMKEVKIKEILNDKIYLRRNIVKVNENSTENDFHGWEFEEAEMLLDEYISQMDLLGQQNTDLELKIIEQGQYITDLELRLLEKEVL